MKTGEYLAAKVVSILILFTRYSIGKSSQDAAPHHVVLGVQTNPQDARKDFRALPALRWRRED